MSDDLLNLRGQIAFVTGAGQGVGRDIALLLAAHGAGGLAVNDFVLERAESVAEEIRADFGVPAVAVQADVGDIESVRIALDQASKSLGGINLLVNNAGNAGPNHQMGRSPVFWESDPSDWHKFFHTNLYGVMNCCHAALPAMVEQQGGRIVTIISDAGRIGEARLAAYAAAKAAAAGFMRSIAKEVGRYMITANCISLSTIEPVMSDDDLAQFYDHPKIKQQLSQYIIRRFGAGTDVAAMVLFLCSDAGAWITGQTIPVNGGYSLAT